MPGICRIGDPGSHGGTLSSGSSTTKADGIFVCRLGDTYNCAIHGANPLNSCNSTVKVDNLMVATVGIAVASCGATMTGGSTTCIADD